LKTISHSGFITALKSGEAVVAIRCSSACLHCRLKGCCTAADEKLKQITVPVSDRQNLRLGQAVILSMDEHLGWFAVFFAYILPLLLVLSVLLSVLFLSENETLAALLSVGVLLPYYLLLAAFGKTFSNRFRLHITAE